MTATFVMHAGPFAGLLPRRVRALVEVLAPGADAPAALVELDDETVSLAVAEGLGPALGAKVTAGMASVPAGRRDSLLWEYRMCAAANLMRTRALQELVNLYQREAIPILLLKGMAVIQSTCGVGERSMGDVDVLVPPSRWREACALLAKESLSELDIPNRRYTGGHDYVRAFTTKTEVPIEVHRFLCERTLFSVDYEGADGLFARANKLPSGLLVPEDGDLFLTLAAHAAKHTFDLPLRSFMDGLLLQRRKRLHREHVALRAANWKMKAALRAWLTALRLLEDPGDPAPGAFTRGERSARFVWSRTTHASAWQRFVRLAWLSDSPAGWIRHVGTRAFLRAADAVVSVSGAGGKNGPGGSQATGRGP